MRTFLQRVCSSSICAIAIVVFCVGVILLMPNNATVLDDAATANTMGGRTDRYAIDNAGYTCPANGPDCTTVFCWPDDWLDPDTDWHCLPNTVQYYQDRANDPANG